MFAVSSCGYIRHAWPLCLSGWALNIGFYRRRGAISHIAPLLSSPLPTTTTPHQQYGSGFTRIHSFRVHGIAYTFLDAAQLVSRFFYRRFHLSDAHRHSTAKQTRNANRVLCAFGHFVWFGNHSSIEGYRVHSTPIPRLIRSRVKDVRGDVTDVVEGYEAECGTDGSISRRVRMSCDK